ncbi:MAG: secretion system protein [Clostridiales bacterium]|nr:MAG: secretion system protein [Clostridiales bacterium]
MIALISILVSLAVFLTAYLFIYKSIFNDRVIDRVNFYAGKKDKETNPRKKRKRKRIADIKTLGIYKAWYKIVKSMKLGKRYSAHIQKEALRAGLFLRGEEIMVFQMVSAGILAILFKLAGGLNLFAFVGAAFGFLLPPMLIARKKNKRYKDFNNQLGDTIALISNSLKVGHSFMQAVDSVVREMPDPMADEFGKLLREMRLGVQTEEALRNLADRVVSNDLELMVTAIMIQRQTGGNLSGILDQITTTIRDRVRIKTEVKTLTAQGRFSGIIVAMLPVLLGLAITFIDVEYMRLLIENPLGKIMLGGAVVSEILGYMAIKKIVDIKL